jgi:hypothetical protein
MTKKGQKVFPKLLCMAEPYFEKQVRNTLKVLKYSVGEV